VRKLLVLDEHRRQLPPDGLGVSFYFENYMVNGSSNLTNYFGVNTAGCGVQTVPASGTITRSAKIAKARAISCFSNDGVDCWIVDSVGGIGGWKVNQQL
jgi:hypothetical protein